MGLTVTNNLNDLNNKELLDYSFNDGNEYVLYVRDKTTGSESRIRIPASIKEMFEMYWSIAQNK